MLRTFKVRLSIYFLFVATLTTVTSCQKETLKDNSGDFVQTPIIEGIQVKVEPKANDQGYQIVWFLSETKKMSEETIQMQKINHEETQSIQFEIRNLESQKVTTLTKFEKAKTISIDQNFYIYDCKPQEHAKFEVTKLINSKVQETQTVQVICPMDIVMGNPQDELILNQELSNPERKTILIGKWVFPEDTEYRLPIPHNTLFVIRNLVVSKGKANLLLTTHPNKIAELYQKGRLIGLFETFGSKTSSDKHKLLSHKFLDILEADTLSTSNGHLIEKAFKPISVKMNIQSAKGLIQIHTTGHQGAMGFSGQELGSPEYLQALRTPAPNGANGGDGEFYNESYYRPGRPIDAPPLERCRVARGATPGQPGANATLQGVPGATGGPGIPNIALDIHVQNPSPDFQLHLQVSPGIGGQGGLIPVIIEMREPLLALKVKMPQMDPMVNRVTYRNAKVLPLAKTS
jgi:hypothetical protein